MAELTDLPAFPTETHRPPPVPSSQMHALGIGIRPAAGNDLPFFRSLYAAARIQEPGVAALPSALRDTFLDSQFRLQHLHCIGQYPGADFLAILRAQPPFAAQPIGRLYVDRASREWHLIEIALVPGQRGKGLGSMLIAWLREAARRAGATGLALQVAQDNPRAAALYERLGFSDLAATAATHRRMICRL